MKPLSVTCVQYTMETTSLIIYVYFVGVAAYKIFYLAFIRQFYPVDSDESSVEYEFDEQEKSFSLKKWLIAKTVESRLVIFDIIPCVLSFAGIFTTKNPLFIVYSTIPLLAIILFQLMKNVYRKNEFKYDFLYFISTAVVSTLLCTEYFL